MKHRCLDCGYIYDDQMEEVSFDKLNSKWACPECNASKSEFESIDGSDEDDDEKDEKVDLDVEDFSPAEEYKEEY